FALTWLLLVFFLTVVAGFGSTTVGVMFVAYGVWWLVLPPFTGRFADRVGVRTPMIIGAALEVVGFAILALGAGTQSALVIGIGLSAIGIGVSFVLPASNAATMANVPADIRGDASGINMTVRILGSIIGLAVSTFLLDSVKVEDVTSSAQTAWVIALILVLVALVVSAFGIRGVKEEPVLR
ncbi:MAG: MFS transporter, partial [Actinomycetota bacterium]